MPDRRRGTRMTRPTISPSGLLIAVVWSVMCWTLGLGFLALACTWLKH